MIMKIQDIDKNNSMYLFQQYIYIYATSSIWTISEAICPSPNETVHKSTFNSVNLEILLIYAVDMGARCWKFLTKDGEHVYPSSHNHGSGKWVPPILVSFDLG